MRTLTKNAQQSLTPVDAIKLLKEGNARFVNNLKFNRNLLQQVNETSDGQYPFGVILSCIDSRTSAELIFDQGLGDIFSIRIAGNILNNDILGSIEFACKVAGSKLIAVIGHTKCGAVKTACEQLMLGHFSGLLDKLKPAVQVTKNANYNVDETSPEFVNKVAETNVQLVIQQILESSDILNQLIMQKKVGIVGGMYNTETGEVTFCDSSEIFSRDNEYK